MTTRVLFLCPHSAGKSLLAATYFRAAAARHGIDVAIDVAGPDPDETNMSNVVTALEQQGHAISWTPRLVTGADTDAADLVISVGCELESLPTSGPVTEWDVPMLSEDFAGSVQAIHAAAEQMATSWTATRGDAVDCRG